MVRMNYCKNSLINFTFNLIYDNYSIFYIFFSCQDGETQRDIKLNKDLVNEKGDSIPDPTELVVNGNQLSIL